ncbi:MULTISPECIES: hypothetical protein [Brevibacterium]|uniref:Antitoxin VapB39 n=1 Tax=Brevibacterium salitolerans TaxID=1403566 RepID=A0ABP5IT46_9MICO|nr:hypothetical protein [Brevibacterium sp.]
MRTTLDLDERLLAAARERARRLGVTVGQAVSELGLRGLDRAGEGVPPRGAANRLVMLPVTKDHVITDADVENALDED